MTQILSILLQHQDDSLVRLTGLIYRRGYWVESLLAVPDDKLECIRVTAVVSGHNKRSGQLLPNILKLVGVIHADIRPDKSAIGSCTC
ncbi:MAG: acetolactate synthase small subunit [Veillonellales bacterium]